MEHYAMHPVYPRWPARQADGVEEITIPGQLDLQLAVVSSSSHAWMDGLG